MGRHRFYVLTQLIGLFALWLILSGRLEARYVLTGFLSAVLVVLANSRMSLRAIYRRSGQKGFRYAAFLFSYLPWLLRQVITANLQVAYIVLHPRLTIAPQVLILRTTFRRAPALTLLANSITLTPGTLTVEVADSTIIIHSLDLSLAGVLESGELPRRVARLFDEEDSNFEISTRPSFEPVKRRRRIT